MINYQIGLIKDQIQSDCPPPPNLIHVPTPLNVVSKNELNDNILLLLIEITSLTRVVKISATYSLVISIGSLVGVSVLILVCTVLVHIVICWIRRTKSLRQGNTNSGNSL